MKNKLAVFDMDGTLFDTRKSNYEAYKYAVEAVGSKCIITEKQFEEHCFGKNYKQFLREEFNICESDDIELIHNIKCETYLAFVRKYAYEYEDMFQWIEMIRDEYYITLFTSASRKNTYNLLCEFRKHDIFDAVITAEDVVKPKPDMQGCVILMNKFQIAPENTILIDDSDICLRNAERLGICTIKRMQTRMLIDGEEV